MSEVRARKLRRLRWFLLWVKDKPNPRRAGKVTITSSDYASLTPLFQVSLRRNLTKKPPGRDPRRCPLMMSKNGSRRSTTLVASSASRNIATVTRFSCNLSHYGFGHHKSENGIVSDSWINVYLHFFICMGGLCSPHFAQAFVLGHCGRPF